MSKPKQSFLTGEAALITGVPHRTLDYWAKTKLIVPSIADAKGIGTDRLYNRDDLLVLRVARELREAGIATAKLRKVISFLRKARNPFSESRYLAFGSSVVWVNASDEATDVLTDQGVLAFVLELPRIAREVEERAQLPDAA